MGNGRRKVRICLVTIVLAAVVLGGVYYPCMEAMKNFRKVKGL